MLAQRLQSENYSRDNSPRSQLTRPFWLHPSSLLRAGTRHCTLVAHILPPSLRLCFSVSPALELVCKFDKSVGVDGAMWLHVGLLSMRR